ncbi:S24 family peptidase [Sphingomonas gellani]|nr:LexA family transcriptional regulator [Sphingomonas gellani]
MSDMASAEDLKGRRLYEALMVLKPSNLLEGEWAKRAGVNRGYFTDLKKAAGGSPRSDNMRKVLGAIGCTEADLYRAASGDPDAASDHLPTRTADAGEMVEIARLDLSLPMGPGALVDDYVEQEALHFDAGYIRSFTRTPPHRLRLAGGAGDSMFPTLVPNDLVWIDTTQNQLLHADRIYAASINGGAAIKRLRPIAGGQRILVISDNKTIEPYEVDADEVVIWGRVIRFARDL